MTTVRAVAAGWTEILADALQGQECRVHGWAAETLAVPVAAWRRRADRSDHALLRHCEGPVLDIGCGPGRMTHALASLGHHALGIDVVREAVHQTRSRGAPALERDVFAPLPAEGQWSCALLADGNIGIGGDPVRLLRRVRELVSEVSRVVLDIAPPGVGIRTRRVRLECGGRHSEEFAWSVVGADSVAALSRRAGFVDVRTHEHDGRWFAVLHPAPSSRCAGAA